jgi:hypothetical protein
MRREWTLRQILATVCGMALMLGVFWVYLGAQFLPPLLRGGFSGMREYLDQVRRQECRPNNGRWQSLTCGKPSRSWPDAWCC